MKSGVAQLRGPLWQTLRWRRGRNVTGHVGSLQSRPLTRKVHPIDLADEPVSNPEMAHERPHRHRRTTTLDPRRLTASDWLDCSGLIEPVHEVKPGVASRAVSTRIRYFYNHPRRIPFPSDARGFLYYHPPNSNILSPEHDEFNVGHIRFRCATSPETFQEGKDLLLPTKAPWHYAGSHRLGRNHPLWTLARQEGLVTEEAVATYSANKVQLRQFEQPFIVNLAHHGHTICYADKEENVKRFFCITTLLRVHKSKTVEDTRNLPPSYFTNGQIVCHFEVQSLDDQGKPATVGLRIDRVLQPAVQAPLLPLAMPLPTEGELLMSPRSVRAAANIYHLEIRPWELKLGTWQSRTATQILHALYAAQQDKKAS